MSGGVGNQNSLEQYFKIKVQPWGSGENDCLSRVAKTVMNNSGKSEETKLWKNVEEKYLEIQDYNNKISEGSIENADIVRDGQEILVPLEDAIAGITQEFNSVTSKYSFQKNVVQSYTTALVTANSDVDASYSAMCNLERELNSAPPKGSIEYDNWYQHNLSKIRELNEARTKYETSLKTQKLQQDLLEGALEELNAAEQKIMQLKQDLAEYTDRKNDTQDQIDSDLARVTGYIDEMQGELETTQKQLDELYLQIENLTNEDDNLSSIKDDAEGAIMAAGTAQANAENLGYKYDENGNLISPEKLNLQNENETQPENAGDDNSQGFPKDDNVNTNPNVDTNTMTETNDEDVQQQELAQITQLSEFIDTNTNIPEDYSILGININDSTIEALNSQWSWGAQDGTLLGDYELSGREDVMDKLNFANKLANAQLRLEAVYNTLNTSTFSEVAKRSQFYDEDVIDNVIDLYENGGLYHYQFDFNNTDLDEYIVIIEAAEKLAELATPTPSQAN